jgi:hypothetical protein
MLVRRVPGRFVPARLLAVAAGALGLTLVLSSAVRTRAQDMGGDTGKKDEDPKKDEAKPDEPKKDEAKPDEPKKDDEPIKLDTKSPVAALAIKTSEGDAPADNLAQYATFEGLQKVGFLSESRLDETWGKKYDKWLLQAAAKLLPKKPEGKFKLQYPKASFVVEATVVMTWKPNRFYDKVVNDNYLADVTGSISDGDGKLLKELKFKRYWGETPQTPKAQIRQKAELIAAYVILNELMSAPGFVDKVPADKKAEYEKSLAFLKKESEGHAPPPGNK